MPSAIFLLCDHFEIRNRRALNRVLCQSGPALGENDVLERQVLSGDDLFDLAVQNGVGRLLEGDLNGHAGEIGHCEAGSLRLNWMVWCAGMFLRGCKEYQWRVRVSVSCTSNCE